MSAVKKTASPKNQSGAIVTDKVKSFANDPYFIKKAEKARDILIKFGLPKNQ